MSRIKKHAYVKKNVKRIKFGVGNIINVTVRNNKNVLLIKSGMKHNVNVFVRKKLSVVLQ